MPTSNARQYDTIVIPTASTLQLSHSVNSVVVSASKPPVTQWRSAIIKPLYTQPKSREKPPTLHISKTDIKPYGLSEGKIVRLDIPNSNSDGEAVERVNPKLSRRVSETAKARVVIPGVSAAPPSPKIAASEPSLKHVSDQLVKSPSLKRLTATLHKSYPVSAPTSPMRQNEERPLKRSDNGDESINDSSGLVPIDLDTPTLDAILVSEALDSKKGTSRPSTSRTRRTITSAKARRVERVPLIKARVISEIPKNEAVLGVLESLKAQSQQSKSFPDPRPKSAKTKSLNGLSLNQQHHIVECNKKDVAVTDRDILNQKLIFTHSFLAPDAQEVLDESDGFEVPRKSIKEILEGVMVTPKRVLRSARPIRSEDVVRGEQTGEPTTISQINIRGDVICDPSFENDDSAETQLDGIASRMSPEISRQTFESSLVLDDTSKLFVSMEKTDDVDFSSNNFDICSLKSDDMQTPVINQVASLQQEAEPVDTFVASAVTDNVSDTNITHQHDRIRVPNIQNEENVSSISHVALQIAEHQRRMYLHISNPKRPPIHFNPPHPNQDLPEFPIKDETLLRCGSSRPRSVYLRDLELRYQKTLDSPARKPQTAQFTNANGMLPIISLDERMRAPNPSLVPRNEVKRPMTAPESRQKKQCNRLNDENSFMSSVRPRMLQSGQFPRYRNRTPLNTPSINIVSLDSEQADSLTPLPPTSNPSALLVRSDGWDVETLGAEEISVNEAVTTLDRYQNARKNTGPGFYSDSEDDVLQSVRVFPNNRRSAGNPHLHQQHRDELHLSAPTSDQDTPLHEYLDSMVSIHLMKIGSKTTPPSITAVKTTKQATITPKKVSVSSPPPPIKKLKTKTPRPSARISERKSIVRDVKEDLEKDDPTPPQSDTESLDLRFNKAEMESRNLSEDEIPYWIDIFLTASILLEKHVIMIQRTWRRYQNENRHVHFLDAVVYLQRMVRVRRTSHFYKKFRSMTKQKRSLGTTVKRFEEIDSASEISGTGECRRKSSNAFAGIVQANAKYLDMQRRVQERADRIMMQIEAGDLASQRQSTVRQSVAQSVFDEDDEETDKRSLNPLRYRIRDRAQVKLRTENVTANALESSTAELWSQYLRVKDIVEAKYPQVKQSLVAFSESELRSKIRKLIGLARIRTSEPPSTAPVISTSKSIEPTRTQRVSIITPPSPLQTSPTSTASPLCQSTTPPQTFEFQLESQLEYPISECQSEIEACILLEPDSIISNNAITARKSQTQPFRFVKPRSRTSTVSPLPMRILEGTVSDNAELPISLVLRQSSPSAADQEDNPPLLRKSIMRNSRSSATRRTSVTVGPSCIQAQDFELLEETFMTSKPSSLTQRYGRKSIAAVPEDDATYTFPNSSSKRISRVSSTSERRESKSERKSITSAANSLTEKRLLKKLSKIQTLVNKKVALREDRVLKALSELDKSITVQSIIQLVKRSDDELQLIRVKG